MLDWWPFRRLKLTVEPSGPRLRLGSGTLIRQYSVFVSSGNDVVTQRRMVEKITHESINPSLAEHNVRLHPELWEKAPPRRLFGRETIDDEFVAKAVASDLVMTLLWERLGGGTKKEIKAVLKSPTELSLLWFVGENDHPKTPAGKYIGKLMRAQKLRIKRAGPPGHEKNGEVISQVLFDAALQAVTRTKDPRARL
jgi:hypothetical protein